MKEILVFVAMAALTVAQAAGAVTDVSVSQDPVARNVVISYSLSEAAVVTVDLLRNGVSIGPRKFSTIVGDVNRKVKAGTRQAYWRPDREIPDSDLTGLVAQVTAWPTNNPPDFMVVDLIFRNERMYYASAEAIPYDLTNTLYKTDKMVMRKIPAGGIRWRMGGGTEIGNNYSDWRAREVYHYVTFTKNYYMSIYPMTQGQYNRTTGAGVADVNDAAVYHVPVVYITYDSLRGSKGNGIDWPDTDGTVKAGSVLDQIRTYCGIATMDLPTEAEWEFACRAGTSTGFNNGKNLSSLWAASPDGISTTGADRVPVGTKPCNNWRLYDCHGNVEEWCLDWYLTQPYAENSEQTDPKGPTSSDAGAPTQRCFRGGNFGAGGTAARSAFRAGRIPSGSQNFSGFRLKCAAEAL